MLAATIDENGSETEFAICEPSDAALRKNSPISGPARPFTGAIEHGEKDLRINTLVKLANTFHIPINQLFKKRTK